VTAVVASVLTPGSGAGGTGADVVDVFGLVLAVLSATGLVAVVVDTVRLRLAHPEVRKHARRQVSHHPVYAHPYRYPPRHGLTWVFSWTTMLMSLFWGIWLLPQVVNAVGYFAGAASTATFKPTSYPQYCAVCGTTTDGTLEIGGGVSATWPEQVALGQPFQVRVPVWNAWGQDWGLFDGPTAVGDIAEGILFCGIDGFVLFCATDFAVKRRRMRRQLPSRRSLGAPGL
jgi:hypothetical protein